jgi:hypothetical protein
MLQWLKIGELPCYTDRVAISKREKASAAGPEKESEPKPGRQRF